MLGASCDVWYDFDWLAVIGHNQPKFAGCTDLTDAISRFAQQRRKEPILLLTDKSEVAFSEIVTRDKYIAVVRAEDFLRHATESDRSALFFLNIISASGAISSTGSSPLALDRIVARVDDDQTRISLKTLVSGIWHKLSAVSDRKALHDLIRTEKFLPDDVMDVAVLRSRQDSIVELRKMVHRNAVEQQFQQWFLGNPWVFGTDCVRILDDRRIDVENVADCLTASFDGHLDIIELKRPGSKFWSKNRDHDNLVPHADLVKAITQAVNYQYQLELQMDNVSTVERLGGHPIAKPRSWLVHGRSNGWDPSEFRAQRLLNGSYASIQVLTYDQVIARAARFVSDHS